MQVKEEGYEVAHDGLLVTVFSAPNYCDQMGNKGAFVRFNGNDMVPHFTTFEVCVEKLHRLAKSCMGGGGGRAAVVGWGVCVVVLWRPPEECGCLMVQGGALLQRQRHGATLHNLRGVY
jgi:hypothetical protein